jgi:acyl carrier protein
MIAINRNSCRNHDPVKEVVLVELETLKTMIAEVMNIDTENITEETTFVDDLGADSLEVYQIIMGIEQEYDIELANEDVEQIQTVGDAMEIIRKIIG